MTALSLSHREPLFGLPSSLGDAVTKPQDALMLDVNGLLRPVHRSSATCIHEISSISPALARSSVLSFCISRTSDFGSWPAEMLDYLVRHRPSVSPHTRTYCSSQCATYVHYRSSTSPAQSGHLLSSFLELWAAEHTQNHMGVVRTILLRLPCHEVRGSYMCTDVRSRLWFLTYNL